MTEKDIHLGIQVVPLDHSKDTYAIIDEAIKVIEQSGLKYIVTPMETVIQGPYDEANKIAQKAQAALVSAGCKEFLVNIRMHIRTDDDVTMEEKRLDR